MLICSCEGPENLENFVCFCGKIAKKKKRYYKSVDMGYCFGKDLGRPMGLDAPAAHHRPIQN